MYARIPSRCRRRESGVWIQRNSLYLPVPVQEQVRHVRGAVYDGLTLKLDVKKFLLYENTV